jgi:filamentous hemagglutinin
VKRTTDQTFNYVFNAPNARNNITQYYDDIDSRKNFFGTSANYYKDLGIDVKWFAGAYDVSIDSLGGGEKWSTLKFGVGALFTGQGSNLYNWRSEAGNALMNDGFNNFKNLYNNGTNNPAAWDINQLQREQTVLQPIHEKYLGDANAFQWVSKKLTDSNWPFIKYVTPPTRVPGGVDITKYPSRVNYGCQMLSYSAKKGCNP